MPMPYRQPVPIASATGSASLLRLALIATLLLAVLTASPRPACAQASPTASRAGDLQAGGGYTLGKSNYNQDSLRGFTLYSTFDFKYHVGVEVDFHQVTPSYGAGVYERTYEIGGRYVYPIRRFSPYAKLLYGRGVFNYPSDIANLAYNLYTLGAGVDYRLRPSINLRVDYEHQHWFGFPIAPLEPNLITIGVAYHFHE